MALSRKRFSEIPEDAVVLSESEAFQYHTKILLNWSKPSEVFSLKYGGIVLSAATFLSGIYFSAHYRRKFKLLHYGRMATFLPVCLVPPLITAIFHTQAVTKNIILLKENQCPACIQIRSAAIQSTCGCLIPLLMAPIATLSLVHKYGTYNMPYITKEPRKAFEVLLKITRPIKNLIFGIFVGHALLASVETYFEAKSVYTVYQELSRIEQQST